MEREYEVVIWGTRGGYSSLVMLCHCLCHRIRVIAVVANDRITGYIDGYPVVLPAELRGMAYDYILVPAGSDYYAVQSAIMNAAGSVQEKIVSQDVMMLPGFSFQKYQMLRLSRPTILARNCMGGYLYHQFKLQFLSPLINMFFPEEDFLRFASNLDKYLQSDLQLVDSRYNPGDRIWYPVFSLGGDVSIHMNHYRDFSQARKKWEVRKKRMNRDNLIFVFHTSKPEVLDEFQRLPFAKKICFVPFRTEIPCAYYLPTSLQSDRSRNAEWMALRVSDGTIPAYDLWDMLLYGKRTPRMSFLMAKQVDAEELVMTVEYTLQNGEKRLSREGGTNVSVGNPEDGRALCAFCVKIDGDAGAVVAQVYRGHHWTQADMREPIYGLSLRLTSVWQPRYQILYRVHAHRKGWSPWCKDGMQVFQENQPVNAVQIELRDRKESV